jgi:hypothetical protein
MSKQYLTKGEQAQRDDLHTLADAVVTQSCAVQVAETDRQALLHAARILRGLADRVGNF